jgi:Mitochondrial carrier protein.
MSQTSHIDQEEENRFSPSDIFKRNKVVRDWFSGLVAGFTATTICAPLDVARIRKMVIV